MKNTLKLTVQLTGTPITICRTRKAYDKHMRKHKLDPSDYTELCIGVVTELEHPDGGYQIVVGLAEDDDPLELACTVVHELSHVVTAIMTRCGMVCDETRSYMLEWLYMETIQWLFKPLTIR